MHLHPPPQARTLARRTRTHDLVHWLAGVAMILAMTLPRAARAADVVPGPQSIHQLRTIHQLRIYEIFDDTKAAFHDRFRDHAARIMARHGFRILAMWETRHGDRTEFAYLLEWPDEAALKAGWTAFMADREWSDIKARTRDQGPMVGGIEDRTLIPVPYSPGLVGRRE